MTQVELTGQLSTTMNINIPPGVDMKDAMEILRLNQSVVVTSSPDSLFAQLIGRVSKTLIEHANHFAELDDNKAGAPVRTQGAVAPSTVNYWASAMLAACHNSSVAPPVALINLIHLQLQTPTPKNVIKLQAKAQIIDEAAVYAFRNQPASIRDIAKHVKKSSSTIHRWTKNFNLEKRGETIISIREDAYNMMLLHMTAFLEKEEPADVLEEAVQRLKAELAKKLKIDIPKKK